MMRHLLAALAAGLLLGLAGPAQAQAAAPEAKPAPAQRPAAGKPDGNGKDSRPAALGKLGGSSKDPIKIDADRLDVFDRESRAVFSGKVVAVQGDTTIECTVLTVFYEQQRGQGATRSAGGQDDAIKRIECKGPVTVVSKDQIATGDNAVFDRVANKVVMTGNVALSQCQNVTRGERMVYDLDTGVANVETAPGGRVSALFLPGGDNKAKQGCDPTATTATPAAPPQAAQAVPPKPASAPAPKPASPTAPPKARVQTN